MGTHSWSEDCPACGFGSMTAYDDQHIRFGANCPVCGYGRWTVENMPSEERVELAKKLLAEMCEAELELSLEECRESDMLLVEKFGGETDGREEKART